MTSTARPSTVEIFTIRKNCHFAHCTPISHLARVTLDYFHPLPPCQAYMIRPWWLLLSFSHCNVVFHAFLPDLPDQQYSPLSPRTSPSFTLSISSLHWFDIHGEERRTCFFFFFARGGFTGSLDHDALIDFPSPPVFEACLRVNGNKEKCQNDQKVILYLILI